MSGMEMYVSPRSHEQQQQAPKIVTKSHPHRLNQAEQRELQGRMERKQMKDFMTVRIDLTPNLYR